MNTKPRTPEELAAVRELFDAALAVSPDKTPLTYAFSKVLVCGMNVQRILTPPTASSDGKPA